MRFSSLLLLLVLAAAMGCTTDGSSVPRLAVVQTRAIPWHAFSSINRPASPPAIGDTWRANLYVMDLTRDRQQAAAWSPLGIGDFHVPGRFGILSFEGPDEMVGQSKPALEPKEAAH